MVTERTKSYRETVIHYDSRYRQFHPVYRITTKDPVSWDTLVETCRAAIREALEDGYVPDNALYKQESFVTKALSWDSLFANRKYLEQRGYAVESLCRIPDPEKERCIHEVLCHDVLLPYNRPETAKENES